MFIAKPTLIFITVSSNFTEIQSSAILLYEGEWGSWKAHPRGVVVKISDQFLLNGQIPITEEEWDALHFICVKFSVILNNSYSKANNCYEGGFDSWSFNSTGIIIRKGNSFYLVPFSLE